MVFDMVIVQIHMLRNRRHDSSSVVISGCLIIGSSVVVIGVHVVMMIDHRLSF